MKDREAEASEQPPAADNAPGAAPGASLSRLSRRRFAGAGVAVPVVLSLANRPAFGAVCSPSGFVSASPENPSGIRHHEAGCGGLSPIAWANPDANAGAGSRQQWIAAGYFPNPREESDDPLGTLFDEAFDTALGVGTMQDVLLSHPNSLESHAVAGLLNAETFGFMKPYDFVGLYRAVRAGKSFTTSSGVEVTMNEFQLQTFIEQTYN